MVTSLKFIVRTSVFDGLEGCMYERTVKVSKKTPKGDQNPSPNRWKIDTNVMLGKGIPKRWKTIKKMIQKGTEK